MATIAYNLLSYYKGNLSGMLFFYCLLALILFYLLPFYSFSFIHTFPLPTTSNG